MPLYENDPGSYLTPDEAEELLRVMLTEFDVTLEQSFKVGSVEFSVVALDHGEEEESYRATRTDDPLTRIKSLKREELMRCITKLNGQPVKPEIVRRFVLRAHPDLVDMIYNGYKALRDTQKLQWERASDQTKK